MAAAASAWREVLRDVDVLARWGGEEFVALLPGAGPSEARETVERVRTATPFEQTCSAGIAVWDGSEEAASLIARADRALYEAKETGRNRSIVAAS